MKANNSFAIDFIIRMSKNDRKSALIFARITVNGERKEISLKERINPNDWDSAREMVKGKSIEVVSWRMFEGVISSINFVSLTSNINYHGFSKSILPKV